VNILKMYHELGSGQSTLTLREDTVDWTPVRCLPKEEVIGRPPFY